MSLNTLFAKEIKINSNTTLISHGVFFLFISVPEIDQIENGAICKPTNMSGNRNLLTHKRHIKYFPVP